MKSIIARRPRPLGWLLVIVFLVLYLPSFLESDWDSIGANTALFAMIAVGLDLVWGLAGQVSLGQQGFMLVGAYVVAIATTKWGVASLLSVPIALAITAVIAVIVGLVVLRLQHTYLSLASLGLGLMLPSLVTAFEYTGYSSGFFAIPPIPGDFDGDQIYRLYWAATLVVVIFALRVSHSLTGLSWRVIAHNEDLAKACGVNSVVEKLKAFTIAAVIAAVAGAGYAFKITAISPAAFNLEILLVVMVGVVVGGLGSIVGGVIGVIAVSITQLYAAKLGAWTNFIFAAAFVVALKLMPGGLIPTVGKVSRWVRGRVKATRVQGGGASTAEADAAAKATEEAAAAQAEATLIKQAPVRQISAEEVLVIQGVSKRFGGVTALDDVSLTVHRGEIHGIVGPNGAGKSTLLAVVSGLFPPEAGRVSWLGQDITRLSSWRRARLGVSRSFQAAQVVPQLTVRENVTLGLYNDLRRGLLLDVFTPQFGRAAKTNRVIDETLERFGLLQHADTLCINLAFGQQRLTELARCFVHRPELLLLDEAAAGLDRVDKALLVDQVRAIATEGTTVCLIEHDTDLVSRACDNVTVLDVGTVLARGTGREIFRDADVRASYMGTRERRGRLRQEQAVEAEPAGATAGALDG